jgi:hypothetical protein
MIANHGFNLIVQISVLPVHFNQLRLPVNHLVELFGCGDSALGPQGSALLFTSFNGSLVATLLPLQLQILFFEFAAALYPVMLSG